MTRFERRLSGTAFAAALLAALAPGGARGCSTFKLQKGSVLVYGHNLNQPGMNVPGMIFVNKRGTFKVGRSMDELTAPDRRNPSTLTWISRFGSVTFSTFGRDLPDGGINEAGLYVWEMNDETEYPRDESLPRLVQMGWMQLVLDTCSTLDEAIATVSRVRIEGWGWHYFLGDGEGRCAAVEFIRGRTVVHRDDGMPVPGLFNEPYDRELSLLPLFKGFGGTYEPDLGSPKVPRFVKTAVLVRDYDPAQDPVAYGWRMIEALKVTETPKWSVLIDARSGAVQFRTERDPAIKTFSLRGFDFSGATPVLALNMAVAKGGDVAPLFHPASVGEIRDLLASLPMPDGFYEELGISKAELVERFATHHLAGAEPARQPFRGTWTSVREQGKDDPGIVLELRSSGDAVAGEIRNAKGEAYSIDHLTLVGDDLSFSFRNAKGTIQVVEAKLAGDAMDLRLSSIDGRLGSCRMRKAGA